MQWAEPVTGSSGIPCAGAKKRETKSQSAPAAAPTRTGFSAHVPDLPGCIATGPTVEVVKERMAKAIEMHLAAMSEDGDAIPEPSLLETVEVR